MKHDFLLVYFKSKMHNYIIYEMYFDYKQLLIFLKQSKTQAYLI